MRLREATALALAVAMAAAGCSRVAFIKTDPGRRGYEAVSTPTEFHESPAARQRAALRAQLAIAQSALLRGDLGGAEAAARKAQRADASSPDPETLLGLIAERNGRQAEAGAHYLRAAGLAPKDGGAANNYGAWLCASGRAAESLAWFERALADPGYRTPAAALANSGACALRAGRLDKATRDLRAAIAQDGANPVALGALARLEFQAGRYLEARAFSERRLAAAPPDAAALGLASQIEQKLGDTAAAARYVRRLREEFPDKPSGNPGDTTQR